VQVLESKRGVFVFWPKEKRGGEKTDRGEEGNTFLEKEALGLKLVTGGPLVIRGMQGKGGGKGNPIFSSYGREGLKRKERAGGKRKVSFEEEGRVFHTVSEGEML